MCHSIQRRALDYHLLKLILLIPRLQLVGKYRFESKYAGFRQTPSMIICLPLPFGASLFSHRSQILIADQSFFPAISVLPNARSPTRRYRRPFDCSLIQSFIHFAPVIAAVGTNLLDFFCDRP
jgi:hypothetical protein